MRTFIRGVGTIPTLTSISPTHGNEGDTVTATGTDFEDTPEVYVHGVLADNIVWVSATEVQFDVPTGPDPGVQELDDVRIVNPSRLSCRKYSAWTYDYIGIVGALSPTNGTAAGGTTVTINGFGFSAGTPTVTFGGTAGTNVTVINDEQLTVDTPERAAGVVDVVVTVNGHTATKTNGYTHNTIFTSITANSGDDWDAQAVTIAGAGFAGSPTVTIGGVTATSIVVVGLTSITCVVPTKVVSSGSSAAVDVVVTSGGVAATGSGAYTYNLTPWSLSPDLWHRSDRGVTTSSGAVTAWANQGTAAADSNSNFTDAGNSAFRPTFNASDANFNNHPSFSFTTSSNHLRTGTLAASIATPQTYVVVGKKSSTATDGTIYLGLIATANLWAYKNASDANLYIIDTAAATVGAHDIFILIVTFNGASSTWMLNSTTSNTVNLGATHTLTDLKCFAVNGGNNGSTGVETVAMAGAMSLGDRQRLMTALGARYGITIS